MLSMQCLIFDCFSDISIALLTHYTRKQLINCVISVYLYCPRIPESACRCGCSLPTNASEKERAK